jgi:hypothetical protein
VVDPDKGFDWGSDLVGIPDALGTLEVEEVIVVADVGGDGDNAVAGDVENDEAVFVEEAKDQTGRESDVEDEEELVGGDKAIERLKGVHTDQSGRVDLEDKAFDLLVFVITGEGFHLVIHEADSRDVKELVGCMDSLTDEEQGNMEVDLKNSKHVPGEARGSDEEVDLVEVIVRRGRLVGADERLG